MTAEKLWKTQWGDSLILLCTWNITLSRSHDIIQSGNIIVLGNIIDQKGDTEGHWLMVIVK